MTGASSGIGLATATALLEYEALVFGVDLSPAPSTLSTNSHFKNYQCNLVSKTAPEDVVQACLSAFPAGRIDVLLNVAGVMDLYNSVDSLIDEDWDRVVAVNLTAPVRLMREVVKVWLEEGDAMKKEGRNGRGKAIVNVSSKAGQSGAVSGIAYAASKHGLVSSRILLLVRDRWA